MTNHSKLHPGEFSRDIAKWHRGVIADIKQLTRGITRGNQVYLPQIVLAERPRRAIRVTACQAPENMRRHTRLPAPGALVSSKPPTAPLGPPSPQALVDMISSLC